jgi:hypothetical protein
MQYRDFSDAVDFITIHVLPYWEDVPVRAEDAAAYVDNIRKRMAVAFPGKDILIGETGWPSRGRMRDEALPSRINQARFISEILDRARLENFRVNLFEAHDERWKRRWEGTVGGHWGLFDRWNRLKYPPGAAVSDHPFWQLQLAFGLVFCSSVFGAAFLELRRRRSPSRMVSWIAIAVSATIGGSLLGVAAEKVLSESYGFGDWLLQGVLFVAAIAAPPLSSLALISARALPTFLELLCPSEDRRVPRSTVILGLKLTVTTVIAAETALGLVFDPRWRDFPFATLTMVAVPFGMLTLFNRRKSDSRPLAEALFAGLFAAAALYILSNEGVHNWQSLWASAAYLLFGIILWKVRFVAVASAKESTAPIGPAESRSLSTQSDGVDAASPARPLGQPAR